MDMAPDYPSLSESLDSGRVGKYSPRSVPSAGGGKDEGGAIAFQVDSPSCISSAVVEQYHKVFERENLESDPHGQFLSGQHSGNNTPYADQRNIPAVGVTDSEKHNKKLFSKNERV